MAVTTRNRGSPAKPTAAATKKAEEQDSEDQDNEDDEEQSGDDSEEEEEEDTFKIHTPKATTAATPKVIPAALPTFKYEDDSEDDEDDSDEAPEAESLSSAKAKIQSAQDKEKTFLSKVQAEQKAKRVEREQKLKEQKDQSKAKKTTTTTPAPAPVPEESATKATGLPTMLPMDILESVAQMDDTDKESNKATANDKKRKHMRPEDFALMELEAELKAEALKRKRTEKKQKNIGPVTVKVLDKSHLAQGHAVLQTVVDFRQQHFYGSKIQRKDAILNSSQRSQGAARKFNRK
ncbi:hypothetical protein BGX24_000978 [Mortierella sp. AD032]|nr:hypothetical protein BGX24_000978 [Mortierella sp. AD032]